MPEVLATEPRKRTMDGTIPMLAGAVSTVIFASSTLPMLLKAARTKDLGSYSLGNILLSNLGNVIHSVYVVRLPAGPVWVLHAFYLLTTALMLVWYLHVVHRVPDAEYVVKHLYGRQPATQGSGGCLLHADPRGSWSKTAR